MSAAAGVAAGEQRYWDRSGMAAHRHCRRVYLDIDPEIVISRASSLSWSLAAYRSILKTISIRLIRMRWGRGQS